MDRRPTITTDEMLRTLEEFRERHPPPDFDRFAMSSRTWKDLKQLEHVEWLGEHDRAHVLGVPVWIDDSLLPGVIERRQGEDEVIGTHHIDELGGGGSRLTSKDPVTSGAVDSFREKTS